MLALGDLLPQGSGGTVGEVSVVAYEDNDPDNQRGPINSEIFTACWVKAGKPADFFSLQESIGTVIRNAPVVRYVKAIGKQDKQGTSDEIQLLSLVVSEKQNNSTGSVLTAGAR